MDDAKIGKFLVVNTSPENAETPANAAPRPGGPRDLRAAAGGGAAAGATTAAAGLTMKLARSGARSGAAASVVSSERTSAPGGTTS